ncbi:MAG: DUF5615 family PIN-like protein [Dehalococcoidia bacterium]
MLRFLLDEDAMSAALVVGLVRRGLDVVTVAELGRRGQSDRDQLLYAAANTMMLFSFNVGDYMRLHTEFMHANMSHSGLIVVQQNRYGVGEILTRLVRLAAALDPAAMIDRMEFLNDWGDR